MKPERLVAELVDDPAACGVFAVYVKDDTGGDEFDGGGDFHGLYPDLDAARQAIEAWGAAFRYDEPDPEDMEDGAVFQPLAEIDMCEKWDGQVEGWCDINGGECAISARIECATSEQIAALFSRVAELEAAAPKPNDVIIPAAIIEKMVNDADFVAKAESLAYQHFPSLVTATQAGQT